MITYSQSTHIFTLPDGRTAAAFYSGNGKWKNDPDSQCVKEHGPLPRGTYTMLPQQRYPHIGPAIKLVPAPSNDMCGRDSFYIHGVDSHFLNDSSNGCICCGPVVRGVIDGIIKSGDNQLQVVK
jgi:hypothetical protein